ncbi:MAG TPA: hypothetical protein VF601_09560 [Beijerinckiaceae bacterium]|jgi:hypothetical protein
MARSTTLPFAGAPALPLAVALALGLYALHHAGEAGAVLGELALPDTDDAMRLTGIRDLLSGQGWFDTTQHRYLPPDGGSMHWSRLVDAPIAMLVLVFKALFGPTMGERLAVFLWPPLLFAAYVGAAAFAAGRLFGTATAPCAALGVGLVHMALAMFAPGRIDHHNVQMLLVLGMAAAAASPGRSVGPALAGGGCAALSLAVGVETLPLIAAAGLVHGAVWILDGAPARVRLQGFAGALAGGAVLLFAVQTSPSLWTTPACDMLSAPWLALAAGGLAAALALTSSPGLDTRPRRLAAAAGAALVLLGGFASLYPGCLDPYGGLPPLVREHWLAAVGETMSIGTSLSALPRFTLGTLGPLLAAAAVATAAGLAGPRADLPERRSLLILAAFLWTGLLTACLQIRAVGVGSAALPLVIGFALARAMRAGEEASSRAARLRLAAAALVVGPLWVAAYDAGRALLVRGAAPPDVYAGSLSCRRPADVAALAGLAPGLVLAPTDLGPALLLHTVHSIVAAPYHRNVAGLEAAIVAFRGPEGDLRAMVERHRADYVVLCRALVEAPEGSFVRDLTDRRAAPWLDRIPVAAGPLQVWRVARDRVSTGSP